MKTTRIHSVMKTTAIASVLALTALVPTLVFSQSATESGVRRYEAGDYEGALRDWQAGAQAGDANALFNLGQAYRLGRGVAADEAKAAHYYQKAADLGHVSATGNLGTVYYFSKPPLRDREKAVGYWKTASQLGDARSQYMLSVLYFNGEVVERDRVRAFAYANLSASNGLAEGRETLQQISRYVTPEEAEKGRAMAADLAKQSAVQVATAAPTQAPKPSLANAAVLRDKPGAAQAARAAKDKAEALAAVRAARAAEVQATDLATAEALDAMTKAEPAAGASMAVTSATVLTAPFTPAESQPAPVAAPAVATPQASAVTAASTAQVWRAQLGAFSGRAAAERQWQMISAKAGGSVSGVDPVYVAVGNAGQTKLQAGSFADRAGAAALCGKMKALGSGCFVSQSQ